MTFSDTDKLTAEDERNSDARTCRISLLKDQKLFYVNETNFMNGWAPLTKNPIQTKDRLSMLAGFRSGSIWSFCRSDDTMDFIDTRLASQVSHSSGLSEMVTAMIRHGRVGRMTARYSASRPAMLQELYLSALNI